MGVWEGALTPSPTGNSKIKILTHTILRTFKTLNTYTDSRHVLWPLKPLNHLISWSHDFLWNCSRRSIMNLLKNVGVSLSFSHQASCLSPQLISLFININAVPTCCAALLCEVNWVLCFTCNHSVLFVILLLLNATSFWWNKVYHKAVRLPMDRILIIPLS